MNIPDGPQELTAEWLTQALRATETITTARVSSFTAHSFDEEHGITGQLVRLNLEYDRDGIEAPRTLIAKFHSADPQIQAALKMLGMYEREVGFYRQIAHQVELRTPRCYYGDIDNGERFVLLFEDLAPARAGDTVVGCFKAEAERAIRQIARFHVTWWEHARLSQMDWLPQWDLLCIQQAMQQRWEPFVKRVGGQLPSTILDIGEHLITYYSDICDSLISPPRTLIHYDYQFDNLLYSISQRDAPFAVIDWQMMSLARGVYDVAFFLCRSMPIRERRTKEIDLLKSYHDTLIEHGVREYTFEQCLYDYRLTMLTCLGRMIFIIGGNMTPQTEHKYFDILLPRNVAAIQDLNAGELLPK